MKVISAGTLADLLNNGFNEEVMFSGRVFAKVPGVEFGIYGRNFYESGGSFVLTSIGERRYFLRNGQDERKSIFWFGLRENEQASHSHHEGYGDIIGVPINLAVNAYLQIEPRDIKY